MSAKNKNTIAIALKYTKGSSHAPEVTAKGEGTLAEKIIEVAKANNIPIESDEHLAEILAMVELNSSIPIESFDAVAAVLAKIFEIDSNACKQNSAN